jgi:hypothetical protein
MLRYIALVNWSVERKHSRLGRPPAIFAPESVGSIGYKVNWVIAIQGGSL